MTKNEELYDKAMKSIMNLFEDMSVSKEEAKNNLRGLIDHLEILIDSFGE